MFAASTQGSIYISNNEQWTLPVEGHLRPVSCVWRGPGRMLPEFTRVPIAKAPDLAQALKLAKTEKKFNVEKAELACGEWSVKA